MLCCAGLLGHDYRAHRAAGMQPPLAVERAWGCSSQTVHPGNPAHPPRPGTPLPQGWAGTGAFPNLLLMRLDSNRLNGTLPRSLGKQGSGLQLLLVM